MWSHPSKSRRTPRCSRPFDTRRGHASASAVSVVHRYNPRMSSTPKLRSRRAALALGTALIASLTACQEAPEPSGNAGSTESALTTCMVANSGQLQDRSFNQAVYESLQAAKQKWGYEVRATVSQSPADYVTNLTAMANAGCNYIVTVGWELADATKDAAAQNPEIAYSIVDETVEGENILSIIHDVSESAYLAGYLAAGMTKTGVVGTFGGGFQPPVTRFMDGFQGGVEKYNEVHGTSVRLIGWDRETQRGSFTDDFTNAATARTVTEGLISQGADVIMPVAAQAGEGAVTAAQANGNVAIVWVDSDGYFGLAESARPFILTTVEKHMQPAILEAIENVANDRFQGGTWVGTLENEGVGLAPFHDWDEKVPAELKAEIDDLRGKIAAGEITVETPSRP